MSFIKKQFGSGGYGTGRGTRQIGRNIIQGDKEVTALLQMLRTTAARRVTTTGAAEVAKVLTKKIKAQVPSRFKGARKAIGWRRLTAKESPGGGAKIGARVGRSSKASAKSRNRENRKGVGISAQNIHWLFNDAKHEPRFTGKRKGPERYTGIMLSHTNGIPSVSSVASKHLGEMLSLFRAGAYKQLNKEITKGKAFAR